jgi:hypothetical protein
LCCYDLIIGGKEICQDFGSNIFRIIFGVIDQWQWLLVGMQTRFLCINHIADCPILFILQCKTNLTWACFDFLSALVDIIYVQVILNYLWFTRRRMSTLNWMGTALAFYRTNVMVKLGEFLIHILVVISIHGICLSK